MKDKNGEETYIQERKAAKKKGTSKDGKQIVEVREPALELADQAAEGASQQATKGTEGTSDFRKRLGASRGVSSLHKVVVKKAQGKRFRVQYNQFGEPVGDTRCTLQSYIGHLARTMIPIDIDSWPHVDRELKEKLWLDFKVIKYT